MAAAVVSKLTGIRFMGYARLRFVVRKKDTPIVANAILFPVISYMLTPISIRNMVINRRARE